MAMVKHVGKYNNKKLVIVRRTVPNEKHMALVVFTESLPQMFHDDLMRTVESPEGQNTVDLDEVLFRKMTAEGKNLLQSLHTEGYIKKVPTSQVIVTPTPASSVRLDELNTLLEKIGDDADRSALEKKAEEFGLRDPSKTKKATVSIEDTKTQIEQLKKSAQELMDKANMLQEQVNSSVAADGTQKDSQV